MDTRPRIRDFLELAKQKRDVSLWEKEVHLTDVAAEALFNVWKDAGARLDIMNRLRDIRQHPAVRRHIVDIRADHNTKQLGIQHFVHHAGLAPTRNDIVGNRRRNPEDKRSLGILFFTLSDGCIDAIVVELHHRLAVHAVTFSADTRG